MVFVNSLGQQETAEKFAHLWFDGMARFHRVKDPCTWENANVETPKDN